MKHPCAIRPPPRPSWAPSDGLAYALFLPEEEPDVGRGDPPRRRLGQGEPLRLRARLPRRRHGRARVRRARPRAVGGRASGRARSDDALAMAGPAAGVLPERRAARLEHGRLQAHPRGRARTRRRRAPWWPSARRRRTLLLRLLRSEGPEPFRCDVEATEAVAASRSTSTAPRRRWGRRRRCSCCMPAATSRCRTPISEELFAAAHEPKRLLLLPGGHHRSLQHDVELQAVSRRFIRDAARRAGGPN